MALTTDTGDKQKSVSVTQNLLGNVIQKYLDKPKKFGSNAWLIKKYLADLFVILKMYNNVHANKMKLTPQLLDMFLERCFRGEEEIIVGIYVENLPKADTNPVGYIRKVLENPLSSPTKPERAKTIIDAAEAITTPKDNLGKDISLKDWSQKVLILNSGVDKNNALTVYEDLHTALDDLYKNIMPL